MSEAGGRALVSKHPAQLPARDLAVAQNLAEQAGAKSFATVDGDDRAAAVRMSQKMVAALRANHFKPQALQRPGEL